MPTFSTPESHVNTAHFDSGSDQAIVTLANGGWVVAWEGFGLDGSSYGIFQQAFNADGSPRGGEAQVNTYTTNSQDEPAMTALADGGWVVVWTSRDQDGGSDGVFLQVFNADGSARGGEVQVNTYVSSSQNEPAIATLADGGWVVTWTSYGQDGSNHGIYQQAFNVDGSPRGGEVQVNTTTDDGQKEPAITALEDGGWVVVWTAYDQDGQYEGIVQQVFNADGSPRGGEVVVNTTYYNEQTEPSVAGLTDGGWVVTWTSYQGSGNREDIFQQAFNADGSPRGAETLVNTYTDDAQSDSVVTALSDGGWVVSWNSLYQDGNSDGVFQQAYNADGSVRGGEEQVTVTTDYSQSSPAVSALPDGGWVIAWRSENQDQGPYGSWDGVYQSAFSFVPDGSEGADRLTGSLPDELISGQGGNDTLLGNGGNDTLEGGAGRDRMVGGVGDDAMHGGSDQDTLLGTAGNDIMYGDDGDDVLRGGNDHDLQHGDDGNDIVIGGTGRDTLYGDAGNDILRGNGGFDTVDGGDGDDFVAGGAQADLVLGGAGNDTVQGGGGFDTIDGGTGDDELTGNFNADTFLFADGHGADTITDFEATNNAEKIDLSGISAITSLADLNLGSATTGAATQVGADVVIDTGGGNSITLAGVSLSDLDANDFIF